MPDILQRLELISKLYNGVLVITDFKPTISIGRSEIIFNATSELFNESSIWINRDDKLEFRSITFKHKLDTNLTVDSDNEVAMNYMWQHPNGNGQPLPLIGVEHLFRVMNQHGITACYIDYAMCD